VIHNILKRIKRGFIMRRKEKEISDRGLIDDLIKKAMVIRIAMVDDNLPYIVPMNFGYKNNCLYFHSAKEGRKIDLIKKNNNICFEIDYDLGLVKGDAACNWGQDFCSIIGSGKAYFVESLEEKIVALDYIMEHYSGKSGHEYSENEVNRVAVIKIEIDNITGKKSGK
jgi:uncharacterized protein